MKNKYKGGNYLKRMGGGGRLDSLRGGLAKKKKRWDNFENGVITPMHTMIPLLKTARHIHESSDL